MKVLEESFQFDKSIIFDLFPAWRSSHSCRGQAEERRAQLRSARHKTLQRTKSRKSPPQCRNFILTHPILTSLYKFHIDTSLYNYHHGHKIVMIICSTTFPGKLPIQVPVLSFKKCFHINPVRKKRIGNPG